MPLEHDSLPQPSARLEALRGLAAIQVAVFHCLLVMENYPCNQQFIPAGLILFNGPAAVTLFFVLSGFVLGLSLRRTRGSFPATYSQFAIRRVFRIYPTVVISTFVVTLLVLVWNAPPTKSAFLNSFIVCDKTGLLVIVQQLLFIRFINPVTWTLRMEMVCSLLLPLGLLVERLHPRLLPLALAFLVVAAFLLPTVISVIVAPAFFLGYLLPLTHNWWQRIKASSVLTAFILLLGTLAILLPRSHHWPLPPTTLVEAIGASLIIGSIVYGAHLPLFKVLDYHYIKAAGRVSYSYYVYHPICLFVTGFQVLPALPEAFLYHYPILATFVLWAVSSLFAFPIAAVSYAVIEKPFINYAKTFYRQDKPAPAAA